jgi:site-specific DNA recombinase
MHAIIYAAKSSEDKKGSIPTQLSDCQAMAEREGWEVVGEYQDEAKSAYSGSRGDGLLSARAHAERVAPCVLVVQHTDRLARGDGVAAAHLVEVLLWGRKAGITIRSVQDDSTGESILMAAVMGDRNYEDSRRKSEAVKSGKQRELEKGNWHGGTPPDGYTKPEGGKGLVIDEARAPVIRRIFELALEGVSRAAIVRTINAEGHRTRPVPNGTHPNRHAHDGLPWTNFRVGDVLANPVYAGRLVLYRRTPKETQPRPGTWEPIIDPDDFDRVGAKAEKRKEEGAKPQQGRPTSLYALSHLAVCDTCGRPMYGETEKKPRKDGTKKRSYVCASKRGADGTCIAPRLDAERIDQAVIDHLDRLFVDMETWKDELSRAAGEQRAVAEGELTRAEKELTKVVRQRDTARERYIEKQTAAREDALEHLLGLAKSAEERVADLKAQLAQISVEPPIDLMLDAGTELQRVLNEGGGPVNERLRRIFKEFRIGLVDDDTIAVLPVLLPDLIEAHSDPDGMATVVAGGKTLKAPSQRDDAPVMLLVSPPVTPLEVPLQNVHSAYARCS